METIGSRFDERVMESSGSGCFDEKVHVARRPLHTVKRQRKSADECDAKAARLGDAHHEAYRFYERVPHPSVNGRVTQVAEELVELVVGRQILIPIAEVVPRLSSWESAVGGLGEKRRAALASRPP